MFSSQALLHRPRNPIILIIAIILLVATLLRLANHEGSRQTKLLINYSHNCCEAAMKRNCKTGLTYGFDQCRSFGYEDLDPTFIEQHKGILNSTKGAGYWVTQRSNSNKTT